MDGCLGEIPFTWWLNKSAALTLPTNRNLTLQRVHSGRVLPKRIFHLGSSMGKNEWSMVSMQLKSELLSYR